MLFLNHNEIVDYLLDKNGKVSNRTYTPSSKLGSPIIDMMKKGLGFAFVHSHPGYRYISDGDISYLCDFMKNNGISGMYCFIVLSDKLVGYYVCGSDAIEVPVIIQ